MHSSTSNTAKEHEGDTDAGSIHSSSVDLARGVDQTELHLHEVSNGELAELVRMLQGWRLADRAR